MGVMDHVQRRVSILHGQLATFGCTEAAICWDDILSRSLCKALDAPAIPTRANAPPIIIGGMLLDIQV